MKNAVLVGAFITGTLFWTASGADTTTTTTAAAAAAAAAASNKCEAKDNKGFAKAKCGKKPNEKCCHPKQEVCVTALPWVKSGTAKENSVCSKTRALYGRKFVNVIMIPVCCGVLVAILLVHMGKKLMSVKASGMKPPMVSVLCFVQVLLGFFVMLTELWKFGVYDAFLSVIVFHAAFNYKSLPNWAFGVLILLQLGNLVAIMGPVAGSTDGVFLPLGLAAADGSTVSFAKKGVLDHLVVGTCSKYFDDYFKLETIETQVSGHDPKVTHFGLCTEEFIMTVTIFIAVKMVISFLMTALCSQMMAFNLMGNKVQEEDRSYVVQVGACDSKEKFGA